MEHLKYESRYIEESVDLWGTAASVMMRLGIFLIFGALLDVSFKGYGVAPGIVLVFLGLIDLCDFPDREDTVYFGKAKSRDWVDPKKCW